MTAPALRIVFFGTPAFAVPTLDALLVSRHPVVGVVTRPDRPRGRGHRTSDAPVKAIASRARVPVLQPERMKDPGFLAALAGLAADLYVVAAYGKILSEAILATPRLGVLNVHASLLPQYRGAAPIHRAVIDGRRETGITIMRMVLALDAGPMIATAPRAISPEETSADVERDLAAMGAPLLVSCVDALAERPLPETSQDEQAATYAPRLTKEEGIVDWTKPSATLHNLIRGLHPWPHAFTHHRGKRLILLRSTVEQGPRPDPFPPPGTVCAASGDMLDVSTGDGLLAITELQAEGRRPMAAREFLAGHAVSPGDRLTPHP